jgi:fatty acid desaturase
MIVDSDHLAYDDLMEGILYEWSHAEFDAADSREYLSGRPSLATWTRYILPALGAAALILAGLVWFVMTHDLLAWIPLALGFLLLVVLKIWRD